MPYSSVKKLRNTVVRILYVTTIGSTMNFFKEFIEKLVLEGHTVDIACNDSTTEVSEYFYKLGCRVYSMSMSRSPFSKGNLKAVRQIKKLVAEEKYDIIHCHTPVASVCTRLACRKLRKTGARVFYTAHGFHFYKGASLKNWLLYYPVEKFCSRFTDVLITINKEDFGLAQKKMHAARVEYVPGVGIDVQRFSSTEADRAQYRRELGIPEDAVLLLSVGELNENKNHQTVISAIADLDVYYIIAGKGGSEEALRDTVSKLHLEERVKLLGYRKDIDALCAVSDIFVFPSFREGLPVSVMEAMASGMPVVCSRIRGNTDLIDENGGIFFDPHDTDDCRKAITQMLASDMQKYGAINRERAKAYSVDTINTQMKQIIENAL